MVRSQINDQGICIRHKPESRADGGPGLSDKAAEAVKLDVTNITTKDLRAFEKKVIALFST
jgi:hypothetical protein